MELQAIIWKYLSVQENCNMKKKYDVNSNGSFLIRIF